MNMNLFFHNICKQKIRCALPILSFPAIQQLSVSVNETLHSAELQAKVMEVIAQQTDTIAAVSLMDLSLEAEAFGARIIFHENEVPSITGQLITSEEDANKLLVPDLSSGRIPLAIEAIRQAKEKITDKPVLAGIIGPFSLAGRLMDVTEIMYSCYDEPELVHNVLQKAAMFLKNYTNALKNAGADGIVIAEPLCGILSPDMAEEFSCPYVKDIIESSQTDEFAVIYHNCGNTVPHMLPQLYQMNATAYHFGNAVDMKQILQDSPTDIILMGNLDPVSCFTEGSPEQMKTATKELLEQCGHYDNFILSSGCDIPHTASWKNINAFYEALEEYNNR